MAGVPSAVTLAGEQTGALHGTARLPDKDDLAACLHRLRPFVLSDSDVHFFKIAGIFGKRAARGSLVRKGFKSKGRRFRVDDSLAQLGYKFEVEGYDVVSEEFFMLWMNAEEYHHDNDRRAALDVVSSVLPADVCRGLMMELLRRKIDAVLWLARIVDRALDKGQPVS